MSQGAARTAWSAGAADATRAIRIPATVHVASADSPSRRSGPESRPVMRPGGGVTALPGSGGAGAAEAGSLTCR
jgi:hypothetical protein